MRKWMTVAVGATIAAAMLLFVPIAASADSTPPPKPGVVVDPRPVPTAINGSKVLDAPAPLGAHLPKLAPGQSVTVAAPPAAASAHQLKIMPVTVHQLKVMGR